MTDKIDLIIKFDNSTVNELSERATSMLPSGPPTQLNPLEKSIHFLRGVDSRVGFSLIAFYMFVGSSEKGSNSCFIDGYPGTVFQNYTEHVSLNNIALACRKAFDHGVKGALTGASFAKTNDQTLEEHARYWADLSNNSIEDSRKALHLLRSFFGLCSKNNAEILKSNSTLGRRIALIKQYADRSASHLTMENYNVDAFDLAHVVASLTLVAEIIRSFDRPDTNSTYFNDIDEAAYVAAKGLFPNMIEIRLFQEINVENQAKLCWEWEEQRGLHMLMEQLPHATSFF